MNESWFDTAEVCVLGHTSNESTRSYPQHNKSFCERCGSKTIQSCQNCLTPIRGDYHVPDIFVPISYTPPAHCFKCGQPFPWTVAITNAVQELVLESEVLSLQEQATLTQAIEDLVKDSPMTVVATIRFKKLMLRVGQGTADAFKTILVDVLSEATKKAIWG